MALALLPREAMAAWERVAAGPRPVSGFSPAHLALVNAVADTVIPRTDTPGASDVNVAAFVDVIVNEHYSDAERSAFLVGLDGIDAMAFAVGVPAFADLGSEARARLVERIESGSDRSVQPQRTYWRLKGLVVHGYFTSERVMKDVLHHQVMPGAFNGNAPMPPRPALAGQPRG